MLIIIFIVGILIGSLGGIVMKMGAAQMGHVQVSTLPQMVGYVFKLLSNPLSFTGLAMYFLAGVIWSYLLIKLDISFVQPILALTYVITPILAIFLLHEHVTLMRWLGIVIVICGVLVVARTAS